MINIDNSIKISIIIPVYNTQKHLKKCLDSIIDEDIGGYEIILVDDGSTDNSPQICDEYEKRYEFVKVIHKENGGLATARNAGMGIAKGEYITFIDSDDYVNDKYIELIKKSTCNGDDIIAFSYLVDYTQRSYTKVYSLSCKQSIIPADAVHDLESNKAFNVVWNKIYKKYMLESMPATSFKPGSEPGEDLIFNVECFLKAKSITIVDKPYYHWVRREEDTLANRFRSDLTERNLQFIEYRNNLYGTLGIQDKYFDLLAKGNLEYIFACIPNMYRKDKCICKKTRIDFYKNILASQKVKLWIKTVNPVQTLHKQFYVLYKFGSPTLMDAFYFVTMGLRNNFGSLWVLLREKFS